MALKNLEYEKEEKIRNEKQQKLNIEEFERISRLKEARKRLRREIP